MSNLLPLLNAAITAASALLLLVAGAATLGNLLLSSFDNPALDTVRFRFAESIIAVLGLLGAATLLKTLTLESWSALGLFALVFTLRLLIKRSLAAALRSAEAR